MTQRTAAFALWTAVATAAVGCGGEAPLSSDVDVLIDQMGVPHIYAATDEDAMVASGYMMARMRLFQIEMVRRQAWGTQSEVLGEGSFAADAASRTLNFARYGRESRTRMEREFPQYATLIRAFVRGINLYIDRAARGAEPLPAEFGVDALSYTPQRFSDDDPYVIGKMLSFGMSNSLDSEILATVLGTLAPQVADFPLNLPTRAAYTMPGASQIMPLAAPPGEAKIAPFDHPQRAAIAAALSAYRPISTNNGSNNWAVAGRFTQNGRPLLSGDPHQPLRNPIRFFVQHLSSIDRGGSLDVIGFGFAGAPGVQLGHNRQVGWTATTNFADVIDLWRVSTRAAGDVEQTQVGTTWVPVARRQETIRIRNPQGPAATTDGVGSVRTVAIGDVGELGVLLPDEMLPLPRFLITPGGEEILLRWTGQRATIDAAMYLGFDQAGSLDDWEQIAGRLEVGAVNLVAADQRSIRYRVHADVPRRDGVRSGTQLWKLMDGRDPRTLWTGQFLRDGELPYARDPERGYLCTANNDPWGFTGDGRVDNDPFYYGNYFDPGDRAARIESELRRLIREKPGRIDREDMKALQRDAHSTVADDLLPALQQAVAAIDRDPALAEFKGRTDLIKLAARLGAWDRRMVRDSTEAVLFFAFAHFATERAESDEFGPFLARLWDAEPAFAYKPLRLALRGVAGTTGILQEGQARILLDGLARAHAWAKTRFGVAQPESDRTFAWRDVHGARFNHMLGGMWNAGVFPVDGSVGTVNVSSSAMSDGAGGVRDRFAADDGSLYRMVLGFDDDGQPSAEVNFPRGNDANAGTRFYNNQQQAWQDVQYAPLRFRRAAVEAATVERITLSRSGNPKSE